MVQEINKIVDLLEDIRTINNHNSGKVDQLISNVNNRINMLKHKYANQLFKSFYEEIISSIENRFSITNESLHAIENSLNEIYHLKNKENDEKILSKNFHDFFEKYENAKDIFKEARNDLKNKVKKINPALININPEYKKVINDIVLDIETIIKDSADFDWKKKKSAVKKRYNEIFESLNNIFEFLQADEAKNITLDRLLSNLITGENLKINKGVIDSVIEKIHAIQKQLNKPSSNKEIPIKELKRIVVKTDELFTITNNIKQSLGKLTQNIDSLPDTTPLEENLQHIYIKLEKLAENISQLNISSDFELSSKFTTLKEDFSTIKNIVNDLNDILNSKIKTSIEDVSPNTSIREPISKIISAQPKKDDIRSILSYSQDEEDSMLNEIVEKTEQISNKVDDLADTEDFKDIGNKQTQIYEQFSTSEGKLENISYDKEFDNIYAKSSNIDNWLVNSKIKEHKTVDTSARVKDAETKKNIASVLKTTEKIVEKLEVLTANSANSNTSKTLTDVSNDIQNLHSDFEKLQEKLGQDLSSLKKENEELISKLYDSNFREDFGEKINQLREDLLENQKENNNLIFDKLTNINTEIDSDITIDSIKNEIINSQDANQDELITKIAELNTSIDNFTTVKDFSDFTEELTDLLKQILTTVEDKTEENNHKKDILNRIDKIDFSEIINNIKEDLTNFKNTINEDINSINVKDDITELRQIILDKFEEFKNNDNNSEIELLEKYFEEVKTLIKSSKYEPDIDFKTALENIETKISDYKNTETENFNEIIDKFSDIESVLSGNASSIDDNLKSSINEISEIKFQIKSLGETFENISSNNVPETNIKEFVSDKLSELSYNLENLIENLQGGLQQGFDNNSELLEEKTSLLLDVIKEFRHASTNNLELFERLTVTDNKLMDFKQELELVNTDVTNNLNSKTEDILKSLDEIKSSIHPLKEDKSGDFQEILEEIKSLTQKVSNSSSDYENTYKTDFENLYKDLTQKLDSTHSSIRDFILGDIDSVIIKVDNIKDYLTDRLESIVPPNTSELKELNKFVSQIAEFKKQNEEYLKNIQKSINDNIETKHEEIKSILTVALNNNEIIKAIKDLKACFNSKIQDIQNIQDPEDDSEPVIVEEDGVYFDNQNIVEDLKYDFDRISSQIETLSGQNTDIEYILNNIGEKIENIRIENENNKAKLLGENDFDFIKAFDLLTSDIKNLKSAVSRILQDGDKKYSLTAETLYTRFNSNIEKHLATAKNEWLEEIKNYISNEDIKSLVKEVNDKIDILALTSNHTDAENIQVKKLLDSLNAKVDVLAVGNDFNDIEEIRSLLDALNTKFEDFSANENSQDIEGIKRSIDTLGFDNLNYNQELKDIIETLNTKIDIIAESDLQDNIAESDLQITSMLETLNHKIDIIAETGFDSDAVENFEDIKQLIIDQQSYIEQLEPNKKLETFKKCLDELSANINNLSTEKNEEIHKTLKDMKESIMDAVVSIFNQVSFSDEKEDIKEFVEEKTEKIAKNLEEVTKQIRQIASSDEDNDYNYSMQDIETDLAKLRIALNELQNNTIESQSGELTSLKSDITNLKEETRQLLLSSDASFTTLNSDIAYKVDNVAQMLEKAGDSDKVMRQALIYIGEWIDSASKSMNKISSNSDEIIDIKTALEEKFEKQQKQLNFVEKQISKLETLEEGFQQQDARIDRLETNLDKILSIVEDIDSSGLMKKVEKIDKQLSKLSSSIEKLVSYVD